MHLIFHKGLLVTFARAVVMKNRGGEVTARWQRFKK